MLLFHTLSKYIILLYYFTFTKYLKKLENLNKTNIHYPATP